MALLIITAKSSFLPDPDDLCGWEMLEDDYEYFRRNVGPHTLYLSECIKDVEKKQKLKHEAVAGFVRTVADREGGLNDAWLIVHDKDLLKASSGDEGIYPEECVAQIGSSLAGLLPDRHIYVFQHVARQDMFEALIGRLLDDMDSSDIDGVIDLISSCEYETPVS